MAGPSGLRIPGPARLYLGCGGRPVPLGDARCHVHRLRRLPHGPVRGCRSLAAACAPAPSARSTGRRPSCGQCHRSGHPAAYAVRPLPGPRLPGWSPCRRHRRRRQPVPGRGRIHLPPAGERAAFSGPASRRDRGRHDGKRLGTGRGRHGHPAGRGRLSARVPLPAGQAHRLHVQGCRCPLLLRAARPGSQGRSLRQRGRPRPPRLPGTSGPGRGAPSGYGRIAGGPGLCHLYLRLHRPAQGGDGQPCRSPQYPGGPGAASGPRAP